MMSGGSIISLIIFISLVAFAVTGSITAMLICAALLCAIWYANTQNRLSPHFQKLAQTNVDHSDAKFHAESPLPLDQSIALLTTLRNQLPKLARAIPLHHTNHLFDDLNLDPVKFELDDMPMLCDALGLKYTVDQQTPLWDEVKTINDLATYIATLNPAS